MLSLRERKKRDKALRIKAAARAVFHDKGYSTATMREVAEAAGVATGTLFLYAADKRDLLILTVIDDLDRLTAESAASVRAGAPFLEQLLDFFRPRFAYWSNDRRLSLTVLQEVQEINRGQYADDSAMGRYQRHRESIVTLFASLVAAQQAAGHIAASESPATLANLINLIYATSVRYWLRAAETPIDDGIAVLRDYLRITLAGIAT